MEIGNRTVMVTGGSAGLGRAIALAFARRGCRVGLIARGRERLDEAAREVERAGGRALALPCDVADAAGVEEAAERLERAFGPIAVWVNSAMVTVYAPVSRLTPAEVRRVTEVTYLGGVHGTMAALRRMERHGGGTIVQVGSALAYRAIPLQSAYCGAKAALRLFTDALRSELIHEHSPVRLTMVQIPAVNTPQFDWARNRMRGRPRPLGRILQPEPVAEAVLRAAETAPRELWVDLSVAKTILGAMALPSYLDRYMAQCCWEGAQDEQPDLPGRADNLFSPAPGHQGSHGRFDGEAAVRTISLPEGWLRAAVAAAGIATLAAAFALVRPAGSR